MLQDFIKEYVSDHGFLGYTELRAQQNLARNVSMLNGTLVSNSSAKSQGLSARVFKHGAYGFASDTVYDANPETINRVIKAAAANASFLESRLKTRLPDFPSAAALERKDGLDQDLPVSQMRLLEFADELDSYVQECFTGLVSRRVVVRCLDMEKLLYTSDGVVSHSFTPRSVIYVFLTAQDKDGSPVELYKSFGGYGNFNFVFNEAKDLFEKIDRLYADLMRKAEGIWATPGQHTAILDADLAGILAHEAVGHTVEADFVQSGSIGGPMYNQQVASEKVTLVDFANNALGERCPVPVYVDDEGTLAEDQVLIDRGKLTGYMHNKESAIKFGHKPNGNARAFAFSDEPLIRMRNTCILPGSDKLADMIASVEDGYYFTSMNNGQADSTGEFMFGVPFGYEIKNGKLGRALKDTTISGKAFDVLKTAEMVSDDLSWICSGMCGKKQMIPVGMGGPAIKVRINVGGRA